MIGLNLIYWAMPAKYLSAGGETVIHASFTSPIEIGQLSRI
jgi:hypothetical protein